MKLSTDSIAKLENMLQVAMLAGFDKVTIKNGHMSGIKLDGTIILSTSQNIPDFEHLEVAFNRLDVLQSRIGLVKGSPYTIEVIENKAGGTVSSLEISNASTKIQYRCTTMQKMPKSLGLAEEWVFQIPGKTILLVQKALSAFNSTTIHLVSKPGTDGKPELYFEASDITNEVFATKIETTMLHAGKTPPPSQIFSHVYTKASLLPLLMHISQKGTVDVPVVITDGGILITIVNGLELYIIAKKD